MDPDPDPGGLKTYGNCGSGSGFGSGSTTLVPRVYNRVRTRQAAAHGLAAQYARTNKRTAIRYI